MNLRQKEPNTLAPRPAPSPGFPFHWLFLATAAIAGALGAWSLWGPMPLAVPLPTTGGTSGEIILLKDVVGAAEPRSLQHRQVQLVGRLQPEHTVALRGRDMAGRSGFYVLTPLVERGNTGLGVLVQRGWVPSDTSNLEQRLKTFTPKHDLVIHGRLATPDLGAAESAAGERGFMRKSLNLAGYAAETGVPLVPLVVLEEFETTTTAQDIRQDFFKRRWPELYPQDKSMARRGWTGLASAVVLALIGFWLWRQRRANQQTVGEAEWASTL